MGNNNQNDDFMNWINNIESNKDNSIKNDENTNQFNNENFDNENHESMKQNESYETQKSEYQNNNSDRKSREYVDKDYVDQKIKQNKPKSGFLKSMALVLVGAILGSFIGPYVNNTFFESSNNTKEVLSDNRNVNINATEEVNIENAVAKKSLNSIVGIHTTSIVSGDFPFLGSQEQEGIGSGVIVSEDGYILTNAHVLQSENSDIQVLLADNTTHDATIVYIDKALDLGMIKIEKNNLPKITFADSDSVEIGDKAIAIGNPTGFNLQSTLTSGYISGLNRAITMKDGTVMNGLIQTDASINSGNSGGALLNSNGDLIGINTAKAGNTDGIGFAIPSNIAKIIVNEVIENGSYTPIVLGIVGLDLNIYKQYRPQGVGVENGVFVSQVAPTSSAEKSGIQVGDIITAIGNRPVNSMNELKQVLISFNIGEQSVITVFRNGEELKLDIVFESEKANI